MILFKEKVVQEGLVPDLLRMKDFMDDLTSRKHNGYVLFKGKNDFITIYSHGKFFGCFDMNGFMKKIENVFVNASSIDVVALSDDVFQSFLHYFFGNKRYAGLRCEFIDIKKFLQSLEKTEFSGTIEVEGEIRGYILMDAGVPQDTFLVYDEEVRHSDALKEILRMAQGKSTMTTHELSRNNVGHLFILQKKTKLVYGKMRSLSETRFHNRVERQLREVEESTPLLEGITLTREGVLRIPLVEERTFLKEEDIVSSFSKFIQALLFCVSDIGGQSMSLSIKEEIEKM
jgi:hypothetical protein